LHPQLADYWSRNGGIPVFGYPLSEGFQEKSATDGKTYLVQYFERNRLEYHPELPEPSRISLGLLGVQVLQQRGWLPGPTPPK
ncbi:MAG TPA: N-acetylmuramoyl-L-alanine amidase, partial [Chloroflexia bacterium]|nr:N-acetylmuramoyl-L-alanine amidase [Chloroflexia bacterium]